MRALTSDYRTLINPFRPEEFIVRITANRRRWIHVFPVDRLGRAKLAHHYVVGKSTVHVLQTVEPVSADPHSPGPTDNRKSARGMPPHNLTDDGGLDLWSVSLFEGTGSLCAQSDAEN